MECKRTSSVHRPHDIAGAKLLSLVHLQTAHIGGSCISITMPTVLNVY